MANDCSERICPFGLAHVDTPKGDLDASSGALDGPGVKVVPNSFIYPYGTQEQFPDMVDSDGNVLPNTAHYYMECSNKGVCDRASGACSCITGYEGSACQRASCPSSSAGVCSGHGTCDTLGEWAEEDNGNIYALWDKDSTMICNCDPGYEGPDCSLRSCKHGFDPLYDDDGLAQIRYSNWTFVIYAKASAAFTGNYSIRFYDVYGEDWLTDPIDIAATCADIIEALEAIPNNVIPTNSVRCLKDTTTGYISGGTYDPAGEYGFADTTYDSNVNIGTRFILSFTENAGKLKQPEIEIYLDGNRPTLFTDEPVSTLGIWIYADGFTGEFVDYVPDYCEGVEVTISRGPLKTIGGADYSLYHFLDGMTPEEVKLLKACLGDSDGTDANNVEVYNWDYGVSNPSTGGGGSSGDLTKMSAQNPHLIKLMDTTKSPNSLQCPKATKALRFGEDYNLITSPEETTCHVTPAGFYAAIVYDIHDDDYPDGIFKIFTPAGRDYIATGKSATESTFYVFTTTGTLQMVNGKVKAYTVTEDMGQLEKIPHFHSNIMYITNDSYSDPYVGNVACEDYGELTYDAQGCLSKGDLVLAFNPVVGYPGSSPTNEFMGAVVNPKYLNIYTVSKISREVKPVGFDVGYQREERRFQVKFDTGANGYYIDHDLDDSASVQLASYANLYKFIPPAGVEYAGECSTRGVCDYTSGTCQCFNGYTNDDCSKQDALAQ